MEEVFLNVVREAELQQAAEVRAKRRIGGDISRIVRISIQPPQCGDTRALLVEVDGVQRTLQVPLGAPEIQVPGLDRRLTIRWQQDEEGDLHIQSHQIDSQGP